jgi:hypothetical protein
MTVLTLPSIAREIEAQILKGCGATVGCLAEYLDQCGPDMRHRNSPTRIAVAGMKRRCRAAERTLHGETIHA